MPMLRLILILALSVLLISCGQQGINSKKSVSMSMAEVNKAMNAQTFECASLNGGTCPSGIARLFIYNKKNPEKSNVCSGFLNGNKKLVTNNHCVSNKAECENTFISIYNGSSFETARCKSIIETKVDPGALNSKGVDFTVMELTKTVTAKAMPVSPYTPYVGDNLTAWVIDHQSLTKARITELNCTYKGRSKSMQLSNCPVIPGNSGSPLLNNYGEIVGVIWGSTVDKSVNVSTALDERRQLNDYALVTELRHFRNHLSSK